MSIQIWIDFGCVIFPAVIWCDVFDSSVCSSLLDAFGNSFIVVSVSPDVPTDLPALCTHHSDRELMWDKAHLTIHGPKFL
jgi:hypothetical protein